MNFKFNLLLIGFTFLTISCSSSSEVQTYTTYEKTSHGDARIFKNNVFEITINPKKEETGEVIEVVHKVTKKEFKVTSESTYFIGAKDNYLITDTGTGTTNRTLAIYDMNTEKKVHSCSYEGEITLEGSMVVYLASVEIQDEASKPSCDKTMVDNGFTVIYVEKQLFNLENLNLEKTGKFECSYSE